MNGKGDADDVDVEPVAQDIMRRYDKEKNQYLTMS